MTTYPGTAPTSFVGAQATVGQRGTLPTFTDGNAYWLDSNGGDGNLGISGSPWKTLGKVFGSSTTLNDSSGNGYNLTQTVSVENFPLFGYPCAPLPPRGSSAIVGKGAYGAANRDRLSMPAGIRTALASKTKFTVEGWFYVAKYDFLTYPGTLFSMHSTQGAANRDFAVQITDNSSTHFKSFQITTPDGSGAMAVNAVNTGRWYYFAFVYDTTVTLGTKLWLGETPETAVVVGTRSNTTAVGSTVVDASILGNSLAAIGSLETLRGFMARTAISTDTRTSFPTLPGTANLQGLWTFSTPCLMQSAPRPYVVLMNSGTWNERVYCPWVYDMPNGFDIYALDGAEPVVEVGAGAVAGTYGPNYPGISLPFTPNYRINQTTGNDATGARNNPTKPFKTIQAALNDVNVNNNDVFEIQDSGIYKESLTFPTGLTGLTLRGQLGKLPVIVANATANGQVILPEITGTYQLQNLTFDGIDPSRNFSLLYGSGAGITSVLMDGCLVRNFLQLNNRPGSTNMTVTAQNSAISNTGYIIAGGTYTNCYVHNQTIPGRYITMYGPKTKATFKLCTFDNTAYYSAEDGNTQPSVYDQCLWNNCAIYFDSTGIAGWSAAAITNCTLYQSTLTTQGNGILNLLVENCHQTAGGLSLVRGFDLGGGKILTHTINCSAIGNQTNFRTTDYASWTGHLTSLNATTFGFDLFDGAGTNIDVPYSNALVSSGDAVAYNPSGLTPTNSETGAILLATNQGAENLTLSANDGGNFSSGDGVSDMGVDFPFWNIGVPYLVNGLTFKGPISGAGALGSDYGVAFTAQYCTFNGLGTYGLRVTNGTAVQNCLFATNGHAVRSNAASVSVAGSIGSACTGAFVVNYGQGLQADHNTAFQCQYGIYELPSATGGVITNTILNGSALYDYSGPGTLSYCCVSTIDPASGGALDPNSLSVDPLFFAPMSFDLRLQTPAIGSFYTSPAIGADNAGGNMGALAYTYGPATTVWMTLDFGAQDVYGNYYRNPDRVVRKELPIKLAEGDRENGAIFSVAATFKREYEFTWEQNTNDMPQAQVVDMLNMFTSWTNELQVDFGLGQGWVPGYFARQNGFEWTDMTGYYSDSAQPTPVRSLTIREA